MVVEKTKDIRVLISESDFDDEADYVTGLALLDSEIVLVKYPECKAIIHELIHLLEDDDETKEAIKLLWYELHNKELEDMFGDPAFLEYIADILQRYAPEVWKSEVYAYVLSQVICRDFENDFPEAIDFLMNYVYDVTGVLVLLRFETREIDILKLD